MKVDLSTILKNFDGSPLENELKFDPKKPELDLPNLLLSDVLLKALGTPLEEDKDLAADVKYEMWEIGRQIAKNKNGKIDFTAKEITLLVERASKQFPSSVIYGNVIDIMDPPNKK